MSIIMLSPIPFKSFSTSAGSVYVADQYGIIPNVVSQADQTDLTSAGCATLNPNPTELLGKLLGANFNTTADQVVPINNSLKYKLDSIFVTNASVNLTTAAGGLYTGAAKSGTTIVAAGQVYTALATPGSGLLLTLVNASIVYPAATNVILSLTTPQGSLATADVYLFGKALPTS